MKIKGKVQLAVSKTAHINHACGTDNTVFTVFVGGTENVRVEFDASKYQDEDGDTVSTRNILLSNSKWHA